MIDFTDSKEVMKLSENLVRYTLEYNHERQLASKYKQRLDIILASQMSRLRMLKSNLGYETAMIMLLEGADEEVKEYYRQLNISTGKYKGLEKVIDGLQTQISLIQSLIKNQLLNS